MINYTVMQKEIDNSRNSTLFNYSNKRAHLLALSKATFFPLCYKVIDYEMNSNDEAILSVLEIFFAY